MTDNNEPARAHHDENLVPSYTLPDPLTFETGEPVTADTWPLRRKEILTLFRDNMYGYPPDLDPQFEVKVIREVPLPGGTGSRRRDLELIFSSGRYILPVLLFLPPPGSLPAPVFAGLNFQGNHTVHPDPSIDIPHYWVRDRSDLGSHGNEASPDSRGMHAACWPVEMITAHGYALATADYCAIAPDSPDHFQNGIHLLERSPGHEQSGAAIASWAWGLSRIREALADIPEVDADRVSTIGHSRLGKTALWAAAEDPAFAMAVSIQSGQAGAAIGRRCFGGRIEHSLYQFPYWYISKLRDYSGREQDLPVDQHELLALIAPRPVYVASALDDWWCDPKGEFLSCAAADPVYHLLGKPGLGQTQIPEPNVSVGQTIGYHIRPGAHSVLPVDWYHILLFADRQMTST